MKVLTATAQGQGERADDYHGATEGELVQIQEPCDSDRLRTGRSCGCGRAFAGMSSHRATTTAVARDLPLTRDDVVLALRASLVAGGWVADPPSEEEERELVEEADWLLGIAARLPVGVVVGRDLYQLRLRGPVDVA